jgi:hypothetical protein
MGLHWIKYRGEGGRILTGCGIAATYDVGDEFATEALSITAQEVVDEDLKEYLCGRCRRSIEWRRLENAA